MADMTVIRHQTDCHNALLSDDEKKEIMHETFVTGVVRSLQEQHAAAAKAISEAAAVTATIGTRSSPSIEAFDRFLMQDAAASISAANVEYWEENFASLEVSRTPTQPANQPKTLCVCLRFCVFVCLCVCMLYINQPPLL
jgi:hypothetical protein